METLISGLSGWARRSHGNRRAVRSVDRAITVGAAALVLVTWAML